MFHQEAQHNLILRFDFELACKDRGTCDFDSIPCHEKVRRWLVLFNILMMPKIFKQELLVVVRFLLVNIEISTVEIEQAVRKLITGESTDDEVTIEFLEYTTGREEISTDFRHAGLHFHFMI